MAGHGSLHGLRRPADVQPQVPGAVPVPVIRAPDHKTHLRDLREGQQHKDDNTEDGCVKTKSGGVESAGNDGGADGDGDGDGDGDDVEGVVEMSIKDVRITGRKVEIGSKDGYRDQGSVVFDSKRKVSLPAPYLSSHRLLSTFTA